MTPRLFGLVAATAFFLVFAVANLSAQTEAYPTPLFANESETLPTIVFRR